MDIVERLRLAMTATEMERITREAAAEIERLRAALKPFAKERGPGGQTYTLVRCDDCAKAWETLNEQNGVREGK